MLTLPIFALPGSLGASTSALGLYLGLRLADSDRSVVVYADEPHPGFVARQITVLPRSRYGTAIADEISILDVSDGARPRTIGELGDLIRMLDHRRIALAITDGAPRSERFLAFLMNDPATPTLVLRQERTTAGGSALRSKYETPYPKLEPETLALIESGPAAAAYTSRSPLRRWVSQWLAISQSLLTVGSAISEVNVTK